MKKVIRLTEKELTNIIKRVINEQSTTNTTPSIFDECFTTFQGDYESIGRKARFRGANQPR